MSGERNNVYEFRGGGAPGGDDDRMTSVDARPTRLETVVDTTLPNLATKGDMERIEGNLPYLATKEDIQKVNVDVQKLDVDVQKVKVRVLAGVLGGIVVAVTVVPALLGTFLP